MKVKDIKYPDYPFTRMVNVKVQDSSTGRFQFDDTYPYLDDSFSYKFNRCVNAFVLRWLDNIYHRVCLGLRIEGRDILKKYKKELAGGGVSICNHVFREDAVMVCRALGKYRTMHIPVFAKHLNNSRLYYWMIRYLGGIPIAETMSGMKAFNTALDTYHARKEWIHVFPEEVRWDFYPYIRPFRKGPFTMAYKYDCPLVPLVITFRKRTGLYRLTGPKDMPLFTIKILEPVFPDRSKTRESEVLRMMKVAHDRMVEGAGIKNNPWPANPCDLGA